MLLKFWELSKYIQNNKLFIYIVVSYVFGVNKICNDPMQWHMIKDKFLKNLWNFRDFWNF